MMPGSKEFPGGFSMKKYLACSLLAVLVLLAASTALAQTPAAEKSPLTI